MKKLLVMCLMLVSLLSFSQISKNVDLLSKWAFTSTSPSHGKIKYNDVWGFVQGKREYAVIGSTLGAHIIDLTDPSNVKEVARAGGAVQGTTVTHRDYHTYKNYLYAVCDQGSSSLQIFDLSFLPDSLVKVYDSQIHFKRAHNIFIDTSSARLFVCAPKNPSFGALSIYSLQDPEDPEFLAYYNGVPSVHDAFIRNNIAYLNCADRGLQVVDFTDPINPKRLTSLTSYPEKGYNHSGWLNGVGDIYVFCDETKGKKVKVYDVSNLNKPKLKSMLTSGVKDSSVAHNVLVKNDFAYFSYYRDGLQIFDISDPSNPIKSGYYDTYLKNDSVGFRGAWGIYPFLPSGHVLVSDIQTGLYVFDVKKAITGIEESDEEPKKLSVYPNPFSTTINIDIPIQKNQHITIALIDLYGREIQTLEETATYSGSESYRFYLNENLTDANFYFLKVTIDQKVKTFKLLKMD